MITLYLSEINELETSDPLICNEFMQRKGVVDKIAIPFSALDADEEYENKRMKMQNKRMKIQGRLTRRALNGSARISFFLADIELTHVAAETEHFQVYIQQTRIVDIAVPH